MLKRNLLLSLLSAVLLSLPWHAPFSGLILLVAWLPLLLVEEDFSRRSARGCWKYYTLTFIVWNIITTYWIYKATLFGAVGAIIGNSVQMVLIFALFRWVKKKTTNAIGYAFLVALWIAWEYFYFDAEISWPWLVLGNGFSKDIQLVQWFEYTGVLGGSLWAWLVNLSLFAYLKHLSSKFNRHCEVRSNQGLKFKRWFFIHCSLFILIILPIVISLVRFYTYEEKTAPCNVVVIQPNIDPYSDKYSGMSAEEQLDIFLSLGAAKIDTATDYVIGPETALSHIIEQQIIFHRDIRRLYDFVAQHPHLAIVTGATTAYKYYTDQRPTETARKMEGGFYDTYNTAVQIAADTVIQLYHKSKLVIGAEKTPYPKFFRFLENYYIDLGGNVGTMGIDSVRKVFKSPGRPFRIGTAICYEGIYGRFYTEYVKKGANLMFIISNDGWWGNHTAGYKQLLYQSSLRAIETRRSIARSANTGISALINQRGEIEQRTEWWAPAALKGSINANEDITFYVRNGDMIGRIAVFALVLLCLYTLSRLVLKHKRVKGIPI
ncbi:MAG: apolipoprotein N-acyltransferase [Bacteroidales bacterium]|nr:apolipoprotein N-acyltransferase [Bacteroidales bacterium]